MSGIVASTKLQAFWFEWTRSGGVAPSSLVAIRFIELRCLLASYLPLNLVRKRRVRVAASTIGLEWMGMGNGVAFEVLV